MPTNDTAVEPASVAGLCVYAAMAHKGKRSGETIRIEARDMFKAKVAAAEAFGLKSTSDVSVQLQVTADHRQVVGAIV